MSVSKSMSMPMPMPIPKEKTIYFGRFISAPHSPVVAPASESKAASSSAAAEAVTTATRSDQGLEIQIGAVLVFWSSPLGSVRGKDEDDVNENSNEDQNGEAEVEKEGRIEMVDWTVKSVEEARKRFGLDVGDAEVEVVCCREESGFFFPGFVDTHIHASQYPNTGIFGQSTLLDWLDTYTFPLESSLSDPKSPMYKDPIRINLGNQSITPLQRAQQIYRRLISRTLSHGTTTAAYHATIDVSATNALADLAFELGQRALIGRVCMDNPRTCPVYYRDPGPSSTIDRTRQCIDYCRKLDPRGNRIRPVVTPRFAPSCQAETLSGLGGLVQWDNYHNNNDDDDDKGTKRSKTDGEQIENSRPSKTAKLMIQTHISETKAEIALVQSQFRVPDDDDTLNSISTTTKPSYTYTALYDTFNLLTPTTILAHGIYLSKAERQLIARRGCKVSHCPASNTALLSGFCPVRTLLDDGIEVGLGTDISGGFSVSVLEMVRQTYLVSRVVALNRSAAFSRRQVEEEERKKKEKEEKGGGEDKKEKEEKGEEKEKKEEMKEEEKEEKMKEEEKEEKKKDDETKEERGLVVTTTTTTTAATAATNDNDNDDDDDDDDSARHSLNIIEALHLATVGGASVVGMAGQMGKFQVGMLWDVQEIDLGRAVPAPSTAAAAAAVPGGDAGGDAGGGGGDTDSDNDNDFDNDFDSPIDVFGWETWAEKVAKWVWSGDDRNVRRVWVAGRLVHQRRRGGGATGEREVSGGMARVESRDCSSGAVVAMYCGRDEMKDEMGT